MAYCKTKTYLNLKRQADRLERRYNETLTEADYEAFVEYELECADYAYMYETEIDWTQVNDDHGHTK